MDREKQDLKESAALVIGGVLFMFLLWLFKPAPQDYMNAHAGEIAVAAGIWIVYRIYLLEKKIDRIAGGIDRLQDRLMGLRNG